ncbi:hypothetical protein NWF32_24615 [Pseudomonas qingdaonensis]|nr:hypothetical protein [Pseudomonas qingdaonensis]
MNLIGGQQRIEDKLLDAVDAINENDALSAHAFPGKATRPSPLTLRDEKLLISEEVREKPTFGAIEARSSNYSVGIITGSEALGLNPQWMIESLLAIGEEEPALNANQTSGRYFLPTRKTPTWPAPVNSRSCWSMASWVFKPYASTSCCLWKSLVISPSA